MAIAVITGESFDRAIDLAERAKARVNRGWCQGHWGRDASGNPMNFCDIVADGKTKACECCLLGSISIESRLYDHPEVSPPRPPSAAGLLIKTMHDLLDDGPQPTTEEVGHMPETFVRKWTLSAWNDSKGRRQAEVLELFGKATEFLKQQKQELEKKPS